MGYFIHSKIHNRSLLLWCSVFQYQESKYPLIKSIKLWATILHTWNVLSHILACKVKLQVKMQDTWQCQNDLVRQVITAPPRTLRQLKSAYMPPAPKLSWYIRKVGKYHSIQSMLWGLHLKYWYHSCVTTKNKQYLLEWALSGVSTNWGRKPLKCRLLEFTSMTKAS